MLSANTNFQDSLRRTFVTVDQAPLPMSDRSWMGPYTFCKFPGIELIKRQCRKVMPPAVDSLMDLLAQLGLTERDADVNEQG